MPQRTARNGSRVLEDLGVHPFPHDHLCWIILDDFAAVEHILRSSMNLGHFYGLIKCMLNLPQNDMLRRSGLPNKAQRLSPSCQLLCCFERLEIGHSFLCAASPYCKGGHTDSNDGLSPYCTSSEFSVSLVDRVSL